LKIGIVLAALVLLAPAGVSHINLGGKNQRPRVAIGNLSLNSQRTSQYQMVGGLRTCHQVKCWSTRCNLRGRGLKMLERCTGSRFGVAPARQTLLRGRESLSNPCVPPEQKLSRSKSNTLASSPSIRHLFSLLQKRKAHHGQDGDEPVGAIEVLEMADGDGDS